MLETLSYEQYDRAELIHPAGWKALAALSQQEVQALENAWNKTKERNEKAARINKDIIDNSSKEILSFLEGKGYVLKKNKRYLPWVEKNIIAPNRDMFKYPPAYPVVHCCRGEVDGVSISISNSPSYLNEVWGTIKRKLRYADEIKKQKDKMLVASIKEAIQLDIDLTGKSTEEIIEIVDNIVREKAKKLLMIDGDEIFFNDCECRLYRIGETRCSCGDKRVSAEIVGNVMTGFYLQLDAY
jgi:hypothetical protein